MSNSSKPAIVIAAGAVVIILLALGWTAAQAYFPPGYGYPDHGQLAVTTVGSRTAIIRLAIQQTVNVGPHGDWLGYQIQPPASVVTDPTAGAPPKYAKGAAIFKVPAHALITVDIHNYDSQTQLRNPFFTQVQGTVGNVAYYENKPFQVMNFAITSHTFTIPDLGVSVPLAGIGNNNKSPNGQPFTDMRFQFRTKGKGTFRWQCIVPCGGGLYGFGDPMSQFGYMNGIFHVV